MSRFLDRLRKLEKVKGIKIGHITITPETKFKVVFRDSSDPVRDDAVELADGIYMSEARD